MTTFLLRATACALFADGWLVTLDVVTPTSGSGAPSTATARASAAAYGHAER